MASGIAAQAAVVLYQVDVMATPTWQEGPLPLPLPMVPGRQYDTTDAVARASYIEPHLAPVLYGTPGCPAR
jgi:hypothetical protein